MFLKMFLENTFLSGICVFTLDHTMYGYHCCCGMCGYQAWVKYVRCTLQSFYKVLLITVFSEGYFVSQMLELGIPMYSRMIHAHSGQTKAIPYGKKGQVSVNNYSGKDVVMGGPVPFQCCPL